MNQIYFIFFLLSIQSSQSYKHIINLCRNNKTISVEFVENLKKNSTNCQCRADPLNRGQIFMKNDDYVHTIGIGFHKLHVDAKSWNDARHVCHEEGGHLAIVNSKAEEEAMLKIFRQKASTIKDAYNAEEALLGIHDLYMENEWVTLFGESLEDTGYTRWSNSPWGQQPDNKRNDQNCGALLLNGRLDDVCCREKFAFFCELPISCAN